MSSTSWGVVDRFQPFVTLGTAPMHYVLAPAGAAVLAAEDGLDVKELGYRHDRVFGIAHSLRLAHTVGVNEWFTALVDRARHPHPGEQAELDGVVVGDPLRPPLRRPDQTRRLRPLAPRPSTGTATGRSSGSSSTTSAPRPWPSSPGNWPATPPSPQATGITTPLLVWLPTSRREATARRLLARAWRELDDPRSVPVATAAAELLNPEAAHPSPADEVWLPLHRAPPAQPRRALPGLLDAWPHVPPPVTAQRRRPRRGPDSPHADVATALADAAHPDQHTVATRLRPTGEVVSTCSPRSPSGPRRCCCSSPSCSAWA